MGCYLPHTFLMKTVTLLIQNAVRLIGLVLIVLGFLFWSHHSYNLIPLHMKLGVALVVLLWMMAAIGVGTKIKPGLIVISFAWGLLTLYFGMSMGTWLPGRAHEIIRVIHFFIGLAAIGLSESLGARIKRSAITAEMRT